MISVTVDFNYSATILHATEASGRLGQGSCVAIFTNHSKVFEGKVRRIIRHQATGVVLELVRSVTETYAWLWVPYGLYKPSFWKRRQLQKQRDAGHLPPNSVHLRLEGKNII